MKRSWIRTYLSEADLDAIASRIRGAERTTAGEIRVSLRRKRTWRERRLQMRDVALGEFRRLNMHRTTGRTGVLILVLFDERRFEILADEGIHAKVDDGTWEAVASEMSGHFRAGKPLSGILAAVDGVSAVLRRHVPRLSGDRDELPDDAHIGS